MRQNGNTVGPQDQIDCLRGRNLFAGDIAGAVVAHVTVKGFRNAFDVSVFQKISCIMGPCNGGAGKRRQQVFIRNKNARFLQVGAHFPVAFGSGVDKCLNLFFEFFFFIINIKPKDVDIPGLIFGGKFNAGHDFNVPAFCVADRSV